MRKVAAVDHRLPNHARADTDHTFLILPPLPVDSGQYIPIEWGIDLEAQDLDLTQTLDAQGFVHQVRVNFY